MKPAYRVEAKATQAWLLEYHDAESRSMQLELER